MQIGKTVCGTFNTCKEVFSLSTAPTFPHILAPIGAFLWLVGKFSAGTAPGVSASAPIKAHHRFVSRKTSYLGRFFSFVVTYLGCLMLLTTCSAEPYPFHKRQLRSNIVLVLGPLFQVRTKFFRGKWSGRTIIPGILVPRTNFFRRTKISVTALPNSGLTIAVGCEWL